MQNSAPVSDTDLDWAQGVVRTEVRVFVSGSALFGPDDEDHLVSACLEHWWKQRDRYDPARGANRQTFLKRITVRRLISLGRSAEAARRGMSTVPLGAAVADGHPGPQVVAERNELSRRVRETYETLSPEDQLVARALVSMPTVAAAARSLGISRQALYRVGTRIKTVFSLAGLEEYLD